MKLHKFPFKTALTALSLPLILGLAACNEKESDDEPDGVYVPTVAVNSFTLQADTKVLSNLDSVFFSIDLERGVIFNADFLPKGTDVSKIVAKIQYSSSVTSAVIEMNGGTTREGTIDYLSNPSDSIDFTGNVVLKLAADNLTKDYRIKVNVHNSYPDSLMWDKLAVGELPSAAGNPSAQKTIYRDGRFLSLIKEADETITCARSNDSGKWEKSTLSLNFTPDIASLTACGSRLYILATDGQLYYSDNISSWTSTGERWKSILGAYETSVVGIKANGASMLHTAYPALESFGDAEIEQDFPVEGFSNMGTFTTSWAEGPTAFIVGGKNKEGKTVAATWAFDGTQWAKISARPVPALSGSTLIPYYNYRRTVSSSWVLTEFSIWLCIGGEDASGTLNRKVYMSYDNGVSWNEAPSLLQLPDHIPALRSADAIVVGIPMSANISDSWKTLDNPRKSMARIPYQVEGDDVDWVCPYIYIFGGYDQNDVLSTSIWRAVLTRLTYRPLF